MSDIFDKRTRSEIMRSVKSKNTKSTELALIKLFKENHITGWRHNYNVKGHPDFVFLNKRIAISRAMRERLIVSNDKQYIWSTSHLLGMIDDYLFTRFAAR